MKIYLKKGREKSVLQRHPWIFSGAVNRIEGGIIPGTVVPVVSSSGEMLASACYNPATAIAARILRFGNEPFDSSYLRQLIRDAVARRKTNPLLENRSALRIIHSEGDALPGLIVDNYSGHLVVQSTTLGMDLLLGQAVQILIDELKPVSIYERSDHPGRKNEGADIRCGDLYGETPAIVEISENGLRFYVDIRNGQKTGFFLDQCENRSLVRSLAAGKKVLNLCSYTGGFTAAAFSGGASEVISLDASADALLLLEKNLAFNGFDFSGGENPLSKTVKADLFAYVRSENIDAGLIIADPPAFAKNRHSVDAALRGYKELNLQIFRKCPAGAFVLTFSCSRFIDMGLFKKVIFSALLDSGRTGVILQSGGHPPDHPINPYHPEGEYLKSLLLRID
jgi:23S rRNA (cytosine1962-C5)-methyltransferase